VSCGTTDGLFWVRPSLSVAAYQALCADDGWTVALKVDGSQNTFLYDSPLWTNASLLNADPAQLQTSAEAKLQPFLDMPGVEIRLKSLWPNGDAGTPLTLSLPPFASLKELFSGGYTATFASRAQWLAAVAGGGSSEDNCNAQGVNVNTGSVFGGENMFFRYRVGIVYNEQNDCNSPDVSMGIGASIDDRWSNSGNPYPFYAAGQFYSPRLHGYFPSGPLYPHSAPAVVTLLVRAPPASHSPTSSPTMTPSPSSTSSVTPSSSTTSSGTLAPSCLPSAYRTLPYHDLEADMLGMLHAPSERDCQLSCCLLPSCTAYVWIRHFLECSLMTNATSYVPSRIAHSGVLRSSAPAGSVTS